MKSKAITFINLPDGTGRGTKRAQRNVIQCPFCEYKPSPDEHGGIRWKHLCQHLAYHLLIARKWKA